MSALAVDAAGRVWAGRASWRHRNRRVGVGAALATPSNLAVLVLGMRTSAPGTHALTHAAGLRGMTPPAAAVAEGDTPSHLCRLDKGANTIDVDGVVGEDISRKATSLAVPDIEVNRACRGVRRLALNARRAAPLGASGSWCGRTPHSWDNHLANTGCPKCGGRRSNAVAQP